MVKHLKIIKLDDTQQLNKLPLCTLFYLIKYQIIKSRTSYLFKNTFYLKFFVLAFICLLFYSAEIPVQLMLDLDKDHKPCANVEESKASFSDNRVLASIALFLSSNQLRAETKNYKVYRNPKFFYSIEYPFNWYPSGIVYSNAFEIRNYESTNPQLVPERNRATLIVVDTTNTNPNATDKFLEGFLVGISMSERARRRQIIDGHRAIRIRAEKPAQPLGPGASKTLAHGVVTESPKSYMTISTYIANGKHLISIETSAPENADASVKEEIIRISDSVKFDNSDSKQIKGGTQ